MLLNGADGQTAQAMQKTLKLDTQTLAEANQTYQNLLQNLPKADPKVTLTLANSIWYRNTFSVTQSFQDLLKQTFGATVSAENFNDAATAGKINAWASEKTNGRIPKVIDQIQPDNILFALNALYFKGNWQTQFNAGQTYDAPFTLASGQETTVRMMRQKSPMRRAFREGYAAFELPYGNDQFAMTVLLPNGTRSADSLLQAYTATEWTTLQQSMIKASVDIGLPKFTMSYETRLNSVLSAMGMADAFTNQANFSKMNPSERLTLSFVKQNTFVAVDEQGTEAAAVTTGGVSTTSVQLPTLCDKPFVFIIHERTTKTILFVGKIANPTQLN
ncbi:serpin family protein [Spirosoma rhododendri]|uniref:serpin family protein n=1 Tax=Spirosoma rhododendri TaxID=2728024 RepID=UPI0020C2E1D6|nr:serpin family protein [Spirosoma rhododendri]